MPDFILINDLIDFIQILWTVKPLEVSYYFLLLILIICNFENLRIELMVCVINTFVD